MLIDSARCHLTLNVKNELLINDIEVIFIPPRLTNLLQPADVSWFRSLKNTYQKKWCNWLIRGDNKTFTPAGNMRSPGYAQSIEWITEAWLNFEENILVSSFSQCGITSSTNLHQTLKQLLDVKDPTIYSTIVEDEAPSDELEAEFDASGAFENEEDGEELEELEIADVETSSVSQHDEILTSGQPTPAITVHTRGATAQRVRIQRMNAAVAANMFDDHGAANTRTVTESDDEPMDDEDDAITAE